MDMEYVILGVIGIVWLIWTNARLDSIEQLITSEHPEIRARITRFNRVPSWIIVAGGVAAFVSRHLHWTLPS
jgi:hypothetical protein